MLALLLACAPPPGPVDLLPLVDPFVGTGGDGFGVGSLNPGPGTPFGQARLGPDTYGLTQAMGWSHCAGYHHDDDRVRAFSHQRLPGVGVSDGGALGVLPQAAPLHDEVARALPLDHEREHAEPGFYRLEVEDFVQVELAAREHAGVHRYTWLDEPGWLLFDFGHTTASDHSVLESWWELTGAQELTGFVRMNGGLTNANGGLPIWFVVALSEPYQATHAWLEGVELGEAAQGSGIETAVALRFDANVSLKVGMSSVDLDGARAHLEAELPTWDPVVLGGYTAADWEVFLSRFEIWGGREEEQATFATALFHLGMLPTSYTDLDGRYPGADLQTHVAEGWTYYNDFSMWDTYRTWHPLMTLAWPEYAADFARSLTDLGDKLGYLPRWPAGLGESGSMIGNSADIVLGESVLKGVTEFPVERAFATAWQQATAPGSHGARRDLEAYMDFGYVPYDYAGTSVARTQEFSIDDHALGQWASWLGLEERAAYMLFRSRNYQHVIDGETGFARGRHSDGSWAEEVSDDGAWGDEFAEGNAWQYTWLAPHDPAGLATSLGGREALFAKLDELFESSLEEDDTFLWDIYYWHGNEPDLHAAFLYAALGEPASTQRWVSWIREAKYAMTPEGLDGNDDGGTLSAWYVFASMGLYPLNGTDRYVLTTPVFDELRVHRPDGTLRITAEGTGDYIAEASIDGSPLEHAVVRHELLVGGRHLHVVRAEEPTDWGWW